MVSITCQKKRVARRDGLCALHAYSNYFQVFFSNLRYFFFLLTVTATTPAPAASTAAAANGNTFTVSPVFVAFAAELLEDVVVLWFELP